MREIKLKTHLIIKDIHNEYHMNWCGKFIDTNPLLDKQGLPIFVIVGSQSRVEVATIDMNYLEELSKKLTFPKGRSAISKDTARIYIKEVNGNEKLMGILTHRRIKKFAPMYDVIGYK